MFDFVRIACAVPQVAVADAAKNTADILEKINSAEQNGADFVVFPELSLSGATCADLFFSETLLASVKTGLSRLAEATKTAHLTVIVGAPLVLFGALYDCAVVLSDGKVWGIVPKTYLSDGASALENRYFRSGRELPSDTVCSTELGFSDSYPIAAQACMVLETKEHVRFAVEFGSDLSVPVSTGAKASLGGAEVLFCPDARPEIVCGRERVMNAVLSQSMRTACAYAYVSAGSGESTTDGIYAGQSLIAENGKLLSQSRFLCETDYLLYADVDVGLIRAERRRQGAERDTLPVKCVTLPDAGKTMRADGMLRDVRLHPFVPDDNGRRKQRCLAIFDMQTAALMRRMTVAKTLIIGVSGGLDSTLALLVCAMAKKRAGKPLTDVIAVTMPCFGTTHRTHDNAWELMQKLGVTVREIDIKAACERHFSDIGQDASVHDVTYENTQARERTQILMDLANKENGIVVGTGDLSETALGWCTYNGDQMSMYGVNVGIPKTLLRYIIETLAESEYFKDCAAVLKDIAATPISPELLPPDENGAIAQKTEDSVGPYELHDFFLYYTVRYGFSPKKVLFLARKAFAGTYADDVIRKWLKVFCKRFYTQQYKRSCMPDGVKIGSVGLSPRGDLRMPSDASAAEVLKELED